VTLPPLPLYDLPDNPYEARELDPLRSAQDADLISTIDGWHHLEPVREYVRRQAAAAEPCLVLVAGESNTGRSSAANHLVHQWALARGLKPERVIVARKIMPHNFSKAEPVVDWTIKLKVAIGKHTLAADGRNALSTVGQETFDRLHAEKLANPGPFVQSALQQALAELGEGWGVAGVIEGICKEEQVAVALQAFDGLNAMLVMVVDRTRDTLEELLDIIEPALRDGNAQRIDLDRIGHDEVSDLVQQRWRSYRGAGVRSPFRDADLAAVFQGRRRTVTHVLKIVEDMFRTKQDVLHRRALRWPHKDLEMSAEFMRSRVEWGDSNLLSGRGGRG
jgi:hypothetical protein